MSSGPLVEGTDNLLDVGPNVSVAGVINGRGNRVTIPATRRPQSIHIFINGNNNRVEFGESPLLNGLNIKIGSPKWQSSECVVNIGRQFSTGNKLLLLLPNSGNSVRIGAECMFSNSITIRCGEYPHLIFDLETSRYLDESAGVVIGNHVWVGEAVFLGKNASIGNDSIVGTRSIVTKRFDKEHVVIAGNPARIVRENVKWIANEGMIGNDEHLQAAFAVSRTASINRKYEN